MSDPDGPEGVQLGFLAPEPSAATSVPPPQPRPARPYVPARLHGDPTLPAGEPLDEMAAAVFGGAGGRARLEPLLDRFAEVVGAISVDDPDFELLSVARMDWALCDAGERGQTWAWRLVQGELGDLAGEAPPRWRDAACSVVGLFEVYPGDPTWVRDRLTGLTLRVFDSVGPWPGADPERPAALWELRLIPDQLRGGFHLARPPLDYPLGLLERLEDSFHRRFAADRWPNLADCRRARLRYLRAGRRTPIERMLQWR